MNWKWPKKNLNGLNPWYAILRRIIGIPFVFPSFFLFLFLVLFFYGKRQASELWEWF